MDSDTYDLLMKMKKEGKITSVSSFVANLLVLFISVAKGENGVVVPKVKVPKKSKKANPIKKVNSGRDVVELMNELKSVLKKRRKMIENVES